MRPVPKHIHLFKTISIHPVLQFIQCLLKMSFNDVNKLGTLADHKVVHVQRAFDNVGYTFNDRVDFQCKEHSALWFGVLSVTCYKPATDLKDVESEITMIYFWLINLTWSNFRKQMDW